MFSANASCSARDARLDDKRPGGIPCSETALHEFAIAVKFPLYHSMLSAGEEVTVLRQP
jgi:hypothetical protein